MSQSTPSTPDWSGKTEFDSRIKAFSKALRVEEDKVREVFTDLGVDGKTGQSLTIIDSDEFLPFGDIRNAFVDDKKLVKLAVLRVAIPHLRGKTELEVKPTTNGDPLSEVTGSIKEMVASNRRKEDMSDADLLKLLEEGATEVEDILSKRTRARFCIIFDSNGNVNVEDSLPLVKLARKQETKDQHSIRGKFVRVYRVGTYPARMLNESPFNRGHVLVDDYCADSETDWTGVCHEARVLARIQLFHCEKGRPTTRELKQICADAKQGVKHFRDEHGKAALLYDEMNSKSELPKLKIPTDGVKQTAYSGHVDRAGL